MRVKISVQTFAGSKFSKKYVDLSSFSSSCLSNLYPAIVHLGPRSVKAPGVTLSRGVGRGMLGDTRETVGVESSGDPSLPPYDSLTRTLQDVVPKLRPLSLSLSVPLLPVTDSD